MTKILYLADKPDLPDAKKAFPNREGDVDVVTSVDEALRMLAERRYDAIVSGHFHADKEGVGLLRTLRRKGDRTPFILFTARDSESSLTTELIICSAELDVLDDERIGLLLKLADEFTYGMKSLREEGDRMSPEEELELANRKLNLLGHVTRHDIRNQLTVLSGYLQLATDHTRDEKILRYLESSTRALENIDKLLEFGKDYEKTGTMKLEWIDAKKTVEQQSLNLPLRSVFLKVDLEGLDILADRLIGKVFYNLVDNALKHGKNVRKIRFHYNESKHGLTLICQDDGFGVKREDKERIFEGKRGRGLYLVSEILRTNGMSIKETGNLGEGARFEIHIPAGSYRIRKS